MALLRRSGSRFTTNIWPGFVDAMTALLLVLMFVLSIFMIIQSVFREKISGQETELSRLENEVLTLISDLSLQKNEYKNLNSKNLAINKSLEKQIILNERKSLELTNTLKNLDLANIKISDFEIRMASLIARRTQLIAEIKQKDNRIKEEVSRLEASRLALASARQEIDEKKELARLAAARREALELYIEDLNKNLNSLSNNKKKLETQLSKSNIALELAYNNLDKTKRSLSSQKEFNIILESTIFDLKKELVNNFEEKEIFLKNLNQKDKIISERERELIISNILIKKIQEDLKLNKEKLSESEKNILIEKLALKNLRKNLNESREELELATLSLEEERKRAIDNLKVIASSEKAMALIQEKNLKLFNENNEISKQMVNLSDLLQVREMSLENLRSQLLKSENQTKISLEKVKKLNQETLSLAVQLKDLKILLGQYEIKDKETNAQVENLGSQLNSAMAQIVIEQKKNAVLEAERIKKLQDEANELKNYRSEFFGNLRQILGNNKGIEIVGDRFVFPSEILFDLGSDELQDKGLFELSQMAKVIRKIVKKIPKEIDWILRVDGHTDKTKFLSGGNFTDNWELSQARALSVVKYFISTELLPAKRFAAAGFGEFQPIDTGETEKSLARNRRIEIKLTER
ncbi:MAG: peptidoglycan -binding protein [Paracoccaceae bacterium]